MSAQPFTPADAAAVVLARSKELTAERQVRSDTATLERAPSAERPGCPVLDRTAALHGLAGDLVRTIEPHTEADPVALLVNFLVFFGSAVGAGPHVVADGSRHSAHLFAVLVGRSSRSRKGTSRRHPENVMRVADSEWAMTRVLSGLSSGEGLVAAVGDGEEDKEGNLVGAVDDKRLMVIEEEFSRVLLVKGRETNTLSAILRQAWDVGDLRIMTKRPLSATDAHISLLGHITEQELRRSLTDTDRANGFANRFLFVAVMRSKALPNGGNLDEADIAALGRRVAEALDRARRIGRVQRDAEAGERWDVLYRELVEDEPGGLVGAITDRAEAQVLRLSLIYALLDGSPKIEVAHLAAAEAVWRYCHASVRCIFGDRLGDEIADKLLDAIRSAGGDGLDGTAQRDVFGRHLPGKRLEVARKLLEERGLITSTEHKTEGRSRLISVATQAIKTTETRSRRGSDGLRSPRPLLSQQAGGEHQDDPVPSEALTSCDDEDPYPPWADDLAPCAGCGAETIRQDVDGSPRCLICQAEEVR